MTFANYGAEFSIECDAAGLSDAAYRTHREAIDWLYQAEQASCRIPKRTARRLPGSSRARALAELVNVAFWKEHEDCYEVIHHAGFVRESLVRQKVAREQGKLRQARWRAKQAGETGDA